MWEETGLRLWSRAQYGAGENAGQVFCRIPEYRAGVDPSEMANLTNNAIKRGGGSAAFPSDALAFNPTGGIRRSRMTTRTPTTTARRLTGG